MRSISFNLRKNICNFFLLIGINTYVVFPDTARAQITLPPSVPSGPTPLAYRDSECLFRIYFDAEQPRLTDSAVSIIREAREIAQANGTRIVLVSRMHDQYTPQPSTALIDARTQAIAKELVLPSDIAVSFNELIPTDQTIEHWPYNVDICDPEVKARRTAEGLHENAPPLEFEIGVTHYRVPLKYFPVLWGNPPLVVRKYNYEYFKTAWPDFPGRDDPRFATCDQSNSTDGFCSHIMTGLFNARNLIA